MTEKKTSAGFALEHVKWGVAPVHIPDEKGGAYKTELVLLRSPERTEKINWWHAPDPRKDPHNHPWKFKSRVLSGWLRMTVWTLSHDGGWQSRDVTHRAGDTYDFAAEWFHTVDEVGPNTVTHMICGPLVPNGEWGHLVDGVYVSAVSLVKAATEGNAPAANPFVERLRAINPHLRVKG